MSIEFEAADGNRGTQTLSEANEIKVQHLYAAASTALVTDIYGSEEK